jgi:replicative DNA helicase
VLRQHVARRLDVEEASIAGAVARGGREKAAQAQEPRQAAAQPPAGADAAAERLLIQAMLSRPEAAQRVFERVAPGDFRDQWCRTAAGLIADAWRDGSAAGVRGLVEDIADEELASEMRAMALEAADLGDEDAARLVEDCAGRIAARPIVARLELINDDILRAQNEGDEERVLRLLAEKKSLMEKRRAAGTEG